MTFVAVGSLVDVFRDGAWQLERVECLARGDVVRGAGDAGTVSEVVLHASPSHTAPLCRLGGLRAFKRQSVLWNGRWQQIGEAQRESREWCGGMVTIVLQRPGTVCVDGVVCLGMDQHTFARARMLLTRPVALRLRGVKRLRASP